MKNKFKLIGIIAVAVIIGLVFASCGDDPKEVEKITVSNWTATDEMGWKVRTGESTWSNRSGVILSWDAVGRNISDYDVYIQLDGKIAASKVGSAKYGIGYKSDGREDNETFVTDKWFFRIDTNGHYQIPAGSYRLGVRTRASSLGDDYSDIVWTDSTVSFTLYTPSN